MPDTFVTPTAAPPKDMLGCVSKDIEASTGGLKPHRKCMRDAHVEHIDMPACDRSFLIGVSLNAGHRRTLYGRAGARQHAGVELKYGW